MSVPADPGAPPTSSGEPDSGEPDPFDPASGDLVGERYRVIAQLARGGMARVYRAHDERLARDVALKVLAAPYATDPAFAERFLAEARAVAALSHPNLVHVYDSGTTGQLHYIVMELLEGYRSLRDLLVERGRLSPGEAVTVAKDILDGLRVVHAHGLVHCDVKAGNVMVGPGTTKLIDFGIARDPTAGLSSATISLGSLHAMSPEQLRGEPLTPSSDLFAVGAVLYVALTGRVPFAGDDPAAVEVSQAAGRPPAPSIVVAGIGPALDALVLQALDPEPRLRFGSADAMSHALAIATSHMPSPAVADDTTQLVAVSARPPAPAHAPTPRRVAPRHGEGRRSTAPLLGILVLATLAVAAVGIGLTRDDVAGPGGAPRTSATETPVPALPAGKVRVPDTIGLSEADAEAKARDAHLDWTIRWKVNDAHQPGVYDQEPRAGEVVDTGSRFTMFAYRPAD